MFAARIIKIAIATTAAATVATGAAVVAVRNGDLGGGRFGSASAGAAEISRSVRGSVSADGTVGEENVSADVHGDRRGAQASAGATTSGGEAAASASAGRQGGLTSAGGNGAVSAGAGGAAVNAGGRGTVGGNGGGGNGGGGGTPPGGGGGSPGGVALPNPSVTAPDVKVPATPAAPDVPSVPNGVSPHAEGRYTVVVPPTPGVSKKLCLSGEVNKCQTLTVQATKGTTLTVSWSANASAQPPTFDVAPCTGGLGVTVSGITPGTQVTVAAAGRQVSRTLGPREVSQTASLCDA